MNKRTEFDLFGACEVVSDEDESVTVEVEWATSAGDYLPFTALPKSYHGKTVALVIVDSE